jgi:hypothetical protein
MEQMNQGHLFQDHRKICANGILYIRCPYGMNVLTGTPKPLDSDPSHIAPDSMVSSNGIPPPTLDHPWTEMRAASYVPDEETDYLYMVNVAQVGHPPCKQLVELAPGGAWEILFQVHTREKSESIRQRTDPDHFLNNISTYPWRTFGHPAKSMRTSNRTYHQVTWNQQLLNSCQCQQQKTVDPKLSSPQPSQFP